MRFLLATLVLFELSCRTARPNLTPSSTVKGSSENLQWVKDELDFAVKQYRFLADKVARNGAVFPRSLKDDGQLLLVPDKDWTSGFFPGGLWYLFEYSKDPILKNQALHFTSLLEQQKMTTDNHDVGFIIMSSYGHAYRLTGDEKFKDVIHQTATSLSKRFNSAVGCTRSWDFGPWKFPVIIDNLMNMELFYWSSAKGGNIGFKDMANAHLDTTLKNHFRPDASSFHLVDYDPKTGQVLKRQTVQGYSDASSWTRGQGWAVYGYTMGYRFTKNPVYLKHAQRVAEFILSNKNMPQDLVPPWDFDVPMAGKAPRDTSAAAVYASALLELSQYVSGDLKKKYVEAADTMLKSLSSRRFRAEKTGDLGGFLLTHAVGWMSGNIDIDRPIIYGDYYYLEALVRRLQITL